MGKETLSLQEKLARRNFKIPNKFVYNALSTCVIKWFLQPKYNVTYNIIDDINDCDGPCFLIYIINLELIMCGLTKQQLHVQLTSLLDIMNSLEVIYNLSLS